jgi:hypothetical protein
VIGVALHVVPQTRPISPKPEEASTPPPSPPQIQGQRPPPSDVPPSPPPSTPEPSPPTVTEDKEPNNNRTMATVITEGTTVRGLLETDQDQDFFKVNPSGNKIGVRLRVSSDFLPLVIAYDHTEKMLAMSPATLIQPATFSFESIPGSTYYIVVRSPGGGQRGGYELEVLKE